MCSETPSLDRILAFAFAIAAHAVLFVLLCLPATSRGTHEATALQDSGLDAVSMLGEVIVRKRPAIASAQNRQAAQPPTAEADNAKPDNSDASASAATPIKPQESAAISDATASQDSSASAVAMSTNAPDPDAGDPLAELRRLRAQAEEQRQIEGLAEMQAQNEHARAGFVVASISEDSTTETQSPWDAASTKAPFAPAATWSQLTPGGDAAWTFAFDSSAESCPRLVLSARADDAFTDEWFDCVLKTAGRDTALYTLSPTASPDDVFARAFARQGSTRVSLQP